MHITSVVPLIALPLSLAKTITIGVGQGGLVFNPETVVADTGDLLQFHYYPKNHSVTQGSFSSPCQPMAGGIYSGFVPTTAETEGKTVFEVMVNSTDPTYLYCSQPTHCQHGMAMVVNPPSTGNPLAAYKVAAVNTTSVSPSAIWGGAFLDATSNSSAASNTNSTSGGSSNASTSTETFTGGATSMQSGLVGLMGMSGLVLAMVFN